MFQSLRRRRSLASRRRGAVQLEMLEDRSVPAGVTALTGAIDVSRRTGAQSETTIDINQANLKNVVVASNDIDSIFGVPSLDRTYATANLGTSFTSATPANLPGLDAIGDAVTASFANGREVYVHMNIDASFTNTAIVSNISTDGGVTYGPATVVAALSNFNDKPQVAVGPSKADPAVERAYATWHNNNVIMFASSADGAVWTPPVVVDPAGSAIDSQIGVSRDGTLSLVWEEFGTAGLTHIKFAQSTDGGATWGASKTIFTTQVNAFIDPPSGGGRYTVPAQADRGTWTALSIDVDRSGGAHDGNIYVGFVDQSDSDNNPATNHDAVNAYIVRSANGGATFSGKIKVNDDATVNSHLMPWLRVDQTTGLLGIGWYDARNAGAANVKMEYWATISEDGGLTFKPNFMVSEGQSDINLQGDGNDYGDYSGASFKRGELVFAWTDNSNSDGNNPDGTGGFDTYMRAFQVGTAVTLAQSTNPTVFGQSVAFAATVQGAGPIPNGEVVTFKEGATVLGTATTVGGVATFATSALDVAGSPHGIVASYPGDLANNAASSNPVNHVVNKANTTTVVGVAPNPAVFGQAVTVSATVSATAPGGGVPDGTATFRLDGVAVGTVTLVGGTASIAVVPASAGPHTVSASYSGAANHNASASANAPLFVVPDAAAPTAALVAGTAPNVDIDSNPALYTFQVVYKDNVAVAAASLGNGNVLVTGPNGFSQLARLVSLAPAGNAGQIVGTYSIVPPGGAWTRGANGLYAISLQPGQVKDSAGNFAAAGPLGSFAVDVNPGTVPTLPISHADPGCLPADSQNGCFVKRLYAELLGRQADATGLQGYTAELDAGNATRQQVVANILSSDEYLRRKVGSLYRIVFARRADATGLDAYVAQAAQGRGFQDIAIEMFGSAEFLMGKSVDNVVAAQYLAVFGRAASASEVQAQLAGFGSSPIGNAQALARQLLASPEAGTDVFANYYQNLLRRTASAAELAAYANLGSDPRGTGLSAIGSSDEYFSLRA